MKMTVIMKRELSSYFSPRLRTFYFNFSSARWRLYVLHREFL